MDTTTAGNPKRLWANTHKNPDRDSIEHLYMSAYECIWVYEHLKSSYFSIKSTSCFWILSAEFCWLLAIWKIATLKLLRNTTCKETRGVLHSQLQNFLNKPTNTISLQTDLKYLLQDNWFFFNVSFKRQIGDKFKSRISLYSIQLDLFLVLFVSNSTIPEMEYIYILLGIYSQNNGCMHIQNWFYCTSTRKIYYHFVLQKLQFCSWGDSIPQKGGTHIITFNDYQIFISDLCHIHCNTW